MASLTVTGSRFFDGWVWICLRACQKDTFERISEPQSRREYLQCTLDEVFKSRTCQDFLIKVNRRGRLSKRWAKCPSTDFWEADAEWPLSTRKAPSHRSGQENSSPSLRANLTFPTAWPKGSGRFSVLGKGGTSQDLGSRLLWNLFSFLLLRKTRQWSSGVRNSFCVNMIADLYA